MAKSISSIYGSNENLVPLYPDAGYYQSKGRHPREKIEDGLDKMREDAMSLSRILDVSFEQVLRWFRGAATNLERHECEGAMKKLLSNCEGNVRNRLIDICSRYSLSICSQKTSSPSSAVTSASVSVAHITSTFESSEELNTATSAVSVDSDITSYKEASSSPSPNAVIAGANVDTMSESTVNPLIILFLSVFLTALI